LKRRKTTSPARKQAHGNHDPLSVCDDVYDVSIRDLGRIKRVWTQSAESNEDGPTSGTYTALEGSSGDGPIGRAAASRRTCVGIARSRSTVRALDVVAARRIDDDTVRINAYRIDEHFLSGLLAARVEMLAEVASLTRREREVLELMLLGRSARDIAAALKISHSTAKFHQANVLDKLGADSRFDLLRVLG
jgi:DNA-binding CsgD family transcriptional regulator